MRRKQLYRSKRLNFYATDEYGTSALRAGGTQSQPRTVTRDFDEAPIGHMTARLEAHPDAMAQRRAIVERPSGTPKYRISGNGRSPLRGVRGEKTEMALGISAYNLRRAINLMTAAWIVAALGRVPSFFLPE